MAKLCNPDIDMITLEGVSSPEPSIRKMMIYYYTSNGLDNASARDAANEYIIKQDRICSAALARHADKLRVLSK